MRRLHTALYVLLLQVLLRIHGIRAFSSPSTRRRWMTHVVTTTTSSLLTTGASCAKAANLPTSYAAVGSVPLSMDSLVGVLRLQRVLQEFAKHVQSSSSPSSSLPPWPSALPDKEKEFKAVLDAYSVPVSYKQRFVDANAFLVYYTGGYDGPGRPNIETDFNELQTQQYGARNEAWVALENARVEYDYYIKAQHPDEGLDEVQKALHEAVRALERYVALAPPADTQAAAAKLLMVYK